ncbi:MAG: phosphoesterase, partial [Firmicutes bacterium]|nr:phosphoesterase [Bacillota bacterium]
ALDSLRKERENRNFLMIEKFSSLGIQMTYDELESVSDSKILTRSHFAKLLMKKGIVRSVAEAFDRFLADGKPAYIKRDLPTCEESLRIISDAGGIAVLAHPYTYKLSSDNLTKLISHVSSIGFTAIECYYPTHTPSQTRHILDLAEKYSLLPSGGSDFHGSNKPNLDLGTGYGELSVSYDILEKLKGSVKNGKRLN